MKRNIIYIVILVLLFSACDKKEDYEVEKSKVVEIAGEWFITWQIDGETIYGPTTLLTYNAASDDGLSIWVDDLGDFWDFKVKTTTTLGSLKFGSADEVDNVSYESKVIFRNAEVFKDASIQPSGAYTDSIYFEVLFDDDDTPFGTVYQGAGVRRTGFLEDEP